MRTGECLVVLAWGWHHQLSYSYFYFLFPMPSYPRDDDGFGRRDDDFYLPRVDRVYGAARQKIRVVARR
jgi:hypothetical protein